MSLLFSIGLHNAGVAILLAVLIWGVTRVWKKPPVAHLLWLLVLVKLVTPPVVNLDLWNWGTGPVEAGNEHAADPAFGVTPPVVEGSQFPIRVSPEVAQSDAALNPARDDKPSSVASEVSRPALAAQPRITVAAAWSAIRPVLMQIWIGGAGLVALLAGIRIVRFQRMLAGMLPASRRLQSVADELATRMGLRRPPDVRVVDSTAAPLVWCLGRRSTVILPLRLLSVLDEHQTAMVLAHELAHLHRRDHWVRVIELVVSVLYWWNPLVWWIRRRLHAAEEQCCDAWVAWAYPDRNHDYAQSLLKAAELSPSCSSLLVLASPFLNAHTLKERIELVLKNRLQRAVSRRAAVCLGLLAAVVIPAGVRGTAEGRGLNGERQTDSMSPTETTAAAVAPVAGAKEGDVKPSTGTAKANAGTIQNVIDQEPIPTELQPFQGSWSFESYGSLKWPARLEEVRAWQWTIHGRNITWTRPGDEIVKLSFTVDPGFTRESKKWPNNIDLTFLDGPDKGQKCLGIFYWFADTDILWICFQDPGAKADRPTKMGFNGYDRHTMLAIKPARPSSGEKTSGQKATAGAASVQGGTEKPLADELQPFQGMWNFGACESELWDAELDVIQKTWTWKVQGQKITWIRRGKGIANLSFTVDPGKTPNQIDFTFLDGPDKGEKCQGIYEFERDNLLICMTEPGAKVARPTRMTFTGGMKTSLLILHKKPAAGARKAETTRTEATPVAPTLAASAAKPAVAERLPFQGTYHVKKWNSDKWIAKPEELQAWQWTIQGHEITWTRPGDETLKLSFSVDPTTSPPQIDLTFLDGPDKGAKCVGSYLPSRHQTRICIPDPGAKIDRVTDFNFKPGRQYTTMNLVPAQILPVAEEVEALQGTWKFELYYSDWWPERISDPPISWSPWRWTVKGNEIRWTGMKVDDVKLSFTVDPSKSPRQIDMTFLDGPHKGKKLLGMYEFYIEGGCHICFADPDAKVDRPTDNSYSTNSGRTMVSIERVAAEGPAADGTPPAR